MALPLPLIISSAQRCEETKSKAWFT